MRTERPFSLQHPEMIRKDRTFLPLSVEGCSMLYALCSMPYCSSFNASLLSFQRIGYSFSSTCDGALLSSVSKNVVTELSAN